MRTTHRTLLTGLALAAAAMLAACSSGGGGGTVSAGAYAKSLCTGMQTYLTDVETLTNEFVGGLDPDAEVDDQKAAVIAFLDKVIDSTDTLIGTLDEAGVPDVDGGDEIVSRIGDSFDDARGVLRDAREQIQELSTSDPTAFATELTNIGSAIESSLGDIGSSLESLGSPELEVAAGDEPACQAVSGGAGA